MTAPATLPRFLPFGAVHVKVPGAEPGAVAAEFQSHVLELSADGGRLLLEHPGSSDPRIRLHKGLEVHVTADDGMRLWSFASRIDDFVAAAPWGIWVLRPQDPAAYSPIQHREVLRVPMAVDVELFVRSDGPAVPVHGRTLNLGGGGLGARTAVPLPEGQRVALLLQLLTGEPPLELAAQVIECRPVDASGDASARAYDSRLAFQDISEAMRSVILRACYRAQIDRRRAQLPLE
jgi:c-di-GMP-binding flagellar brake protein YcgR